MAIHVATFCSGFRFAGNLTYSVTPLPVRILRIEILVSPEFFHPVQNEDSRSVSYQFGNIAASASVHIKHSFSHTEDGEKVPFLEHDS